jgi:hypothetical protein
VSKDEIIDFFEECARSAEDREMWLAGRDDYDPEELRDAVRERECYLAAIRALKNQA